MGRKILETSTRVLLKYNVLLNEWFLINIEKSDTTGSFYISVHAVQIHEKCKKEFQTLNMITVPFYVHTDYRNFFGVILRLSALC